MQRGRKQNTIIKNIIPLRKQPRTNMMLELSNKGLKTVIITIQYA